VVGSRSLMRLSLRRRGGAGSSTSREQGTMKSERDRLVGWVRGWGGGNEE